MRWSENAVFGIKTSEEMPGYTEWHLKLDFFHKYNRPVKYIRQWFPMMGYELEISSWKRIVLLLRLLLALQVYGHEFKSPVSHMQWTQFWQLCCSNPATLLSVILETVLSSYISQVCMCTTKRGMTPPPGLLQLNICVSAMVRNDTAWQAHVSTNSIPGKYT